MTIINFAEWLQKELGQRGWTGNQLAVSAGLDRGIVSRALNRQRMPSAKSLSAIARAFGYPPEVLFRAAGLLPVMEEQDVKFAQWIHLLEQLPEKDRQELLEIAKLKLKMQKEGKKAMYQGKL